jgi:hypothetical protein
MRPFKPIAERLECNERTALKWIGRFNRHGVAGLEEVLREGQTCSLCVRPMGGVTMTEKRGRGGPARKHKPRRHGPEGTAHPPPGPSSHRALPNFR